MKEITSEENIRGTAGGCLALLFLCAIFGAGNKIIMSIYQFLFLAKQTKSLNSQITSLAKS